MNDPIVFSFSINDIFRWIGYITCGMICAPIIFYSVVMVVAFSGFDGIFYGTRRRLRERRERRQQKELGHE